MGYVVEIAFDVGVHYPVPSFGEQAFHLLHGLLCIASGPEPVTLLGEVPLEDRLQDDVQGFLHDAISHGGQSQRALFTAARLFHPHTFDRFGFVVSFPQQPAHFGDFLRGSCSHCFGRLPVDPRCAAVGHHRLQRSFQGLWRPDFVGQRVPLALVVPPFEGLQHPFAPDKEGFLREGQCPPLPPPALPAACSPGGHLPRCLYPCRVAHGFLLPAPLCSTVVTRFFATTRALSPPGRGSSGLPVMNSAPVPSRDPHFTSHQLPSILSPAIPKPPCRALAANAVDRCLCSPPALAVEDDTARASPFLQRLAGLSD